MSPVSIGISDRAHDAFDNLAKQECRERNLLAVVQQAHSLWDEDGRLRCGWAELMGETGVKTLELLEREGVLSTGGFVGIDRDAARVERLRVEHPLRSWIAGDLLDSLRSPELENVGVINFDAYDMVGTASLMMTVRLLKTITRRSVERFGAAVIFVNADLDAVRRRGLACSHALRTHAEQLARTLVDDGDRRRRLAATDLLPEGAEASVDDPAFLGQVGGVEIYRGKPGGHRMANLRVILR